MMLGVGFVNQLLFPIIQQIKTILSLENEAFIYKFVLIKIKYHL